MKAEFRLEYTHWPDKLSSEHPNLNEALQAAADMVFDGTGTPDRLIVLCTGESTAERETLLGIANIRNRVRHSRMADEAMEALPGFASF